VNLIPVEMPKFPYDAMVAMQSEAAAAFDELTRTGRDKAFTEQGADDWPNDFAPRASFPRWRHPSQPGAALARCSGRQSLSELMSSFRRPSASNW
jgi:hypothetical protein